MSLKDEMEVDFHKSEHIPLTSGILNREGRLEK